MALIEWSYAEEDDSHELHLRNLTKREVTVLVNVVAGFQQQRKLAEPELSLPLSRKDGQ